MVLKGIVAAISVLLLSGSAFAQVSPEGSVAVGFGTYSNGFSTGTVGQFGGGAEAVARSGVSVGGSLFLSAGGGVGWIQADIDGSYRFRDAAGRRRATPFVSGGLTLLGALTELAGYPGVNVGGGVLYWFGRQGLKFEVRDVVFDGGFRTSEYWTARVAVLFR